MTSLWRQYLKKKLQTSFSLDCIYFSNWKSIRFTFTQKMHTGAQISTQGPTLYVKHHQMRIMSLCVTIAFLCLSVYMSVCLSKSLHVFVFLPLYLYVSHSLTTFGVVPADQVQELDTGHFKSFVRTLNQLCSRQTLADGKIVNEYDQEIPQSQTADNPVAPWGRAAQPPRDTRKTN